MSWATHKIRQENKEACPPGCYYCVEGGVSGATWIDSPTYKQLIEDYKEQNGITDRKQGRHSLQVRRDGGGEQAGETSETSEQAP